ncbi:Bgt-4910 [Blumeria graminis f. sp. tritici]|uniref:Bgt-4910 n=4 Tax=Blumeria graminis TaxID=34373 RepID=A0A9X9QD97_BLUGR|nr:Bgt-4910 [Blumeria graminis f. sp. tritici]
MGISSLEEDLRIEDYLNDKLQTISDLNGIDDLIHNVEIQQKQLKRQLQDISVELTEALMASKNRASVILEKIEEFKTQQKNANEHLVTVLYQNTPELALCTIKSPMEQLRRIKLTHKYLDLLKNVELLKEESQKHLHIDPKLSLEPYIRLKNISKLLQKLHGPTEGSAVHLVTYVQESTAQLLVEIEKILCQKFEKLLEDSQWPNSEYLVTDEWKEYFKALLELQMLDETNAKESLILLPMRILTQTFVLKFRYHFMSDKPTNHPNRLGDYFFEWFLMTVEKWELFLRGNAGPLLTAHFRGSPLSGNSIYIDPVSAFITSLLPVLREKVESLCKNISSQPQLMSRFIAQVMDFDDALRSKFGYDGGSVENGWCGLIMDVLPSLFEGWFAAEKKFALDRYHEIVLSKNSGEIDYDTSTLGKTKSSYGATLITDLIVTITSKYCRLQKFSHKMAFLTGIQAEILDLYFGRLSDALEYFQTATSAIGRTLHGVTKEELEELQGVKGLDKLCRVFCSSEHLISELKDWSNEEFFIVLFDQLQNMLASNNQEIEGINSETTGMIKKSVSLSLNSDNGGSFFGISIEGFERLRNKAEALISEVINYEIPSLFRPYIFQPHWTIASDSVTSNTTIDLISPELDQPVQTLQIYVQFLCQTIAYAPFRRVMRHILKNIEDLLCNDLLFHRNFSYLGSTRFSRDVCTINKLINNWTSQVNRLPFDLPKLREGTLLLSLPDNLISEGKKSLKEAFLALFSSNEEASEMLKNMGLAHLSISQARTIVGRRIIENSEEDENY